MTLLVSEWFCTNDSILWSSLNFKETQITYVSFLTIDNDNDINFDTLALWPSIFVLITNCDMEAFASTWHIFTNLSHQCPVLLVLFVGQIGMTFMNGEGFRGLDSPRLCFSQTFSRVDVKRGAANIFGKRFPMKPNESGIQWNNPIFCKRIKITKLMNLWDFWKM